MVCVDVSETTEISLIDFELSAFEICENKFGSIVGEQVNRPVHNADGACSAPDHIFYDLVDVGERLLDVLHY